jgi:hypothetical protein
MANVGVNLDYGRHAVDRPDCRAFAGCFLNTQTDRAGFYAFEFEPQRWLGGWTGGLAYVYAVHDGHEANVQVVPDGSMTVVQNLKLPRIRLFAAGQSVAIEIGPESARCTDLEGFWVEDGRCEVVRVAVDRPGCLRISARPTGATGDVPRYFAATTGNYGSGGCVSEPGAVNYPVRGGTYLIYIAMPFGAPAQRVEVSTALQ